MQQSMPPLTLLRRGIFAFAAVSLLAGCANGDFKEVKPFLVRDDIHDWVATDAIVGSGTIRSGYELTDDERQLRDLAYPLIQPPYDRQTWYQIAGEYGVIGRDQRDRWEQGAYATRLFGDRYRSPSARYSRLIDDIRDDTTRLPAFFETATRVLDIDQKRRQSLAYISGLGADERKEALKRTDENAAIVALVRTRLHQRVASYHFALERLVLMTPTPEAAQVELSLNRLQDEIVRYRTPVPSWGREPSLASSN